MQAILITAVLALVACGTALASSSASFEAAGYQLSFELGFDARPGIASVAFSAPGSSAITTIRAERLQVEVFDTRQQVLLLRFSNPGDLTLPQSFVLTVRREVGVLQIGNQSITGRFNWEM